METSLAALEKMCRLCLGDDQLNLHHIFEEGLSNKIIILSGFDLQNNDDLPKHICRDCRWIVEKSYHFRMVAKQSDSRLRKHIRFLNQNKPSNLLSKCYQDDDTQEYEEIYMKSYKYFEEATNEVNKMRLEFEAEKAQIIREEVEKAKAEFENQSSSKGGKSTPKQALESPRLLNKCALSRQRFRSSPTIRRKSKQIQSETQDEPNGTVVSEVVLGDYEIQIISPDEADEIQHQFKKITENTEIEFINEVEFTEENVELQDKAKESEDECKTTVRPKNNKRSPPVKRLSYKRKSEKAKARTKSSQPVAIKTEQVFESAEDHYFKTIDDVDDKDPLDENGEKKIFQCGFEDCCERFARRQACKTHYYNHLASRVLTKGFKCDFCQKTFKVQSALERHERVHTGQKPFKCDIDGCEKAFSQKEMLKRHKVIHLSIEDAPFSCNLCDKKFRQKEPLRQHINKVHSEDAEAKSNLFVCTICQKKFAHSSGLSRHLLIHSGRKFTCAICDKVFNDQSALKRHHGVHNK